ncbi:MAG: putative N6-adenine methyltransferase-domain-containing protein [Monoraphidium minutum]|nr:MAG: putative N6-adenine methyltransferase-domain-containing protein [Monoraphidium minutum]
MPAAADVQRQEDFLDRHTERPEFNQYWYSGSTISVLVQEILAAAPCGRVAFLSTPSLFFSLPEGSAARANSVLLDFDAVSFGGTAGFAAYDFNAPEELPPGLAGSFSLVVIDPPFITEPVWRQYARTAALLLPRGAPPHVIASTVLENAPLMAELFGAAPVAFRPAIPHLVYHYPPTALVEANPEVPGDD